MKKSALSVALFAACGLFITTSTFAADQSGKDAEVTWHKMTGPTFHDAAQAFSSKAYLPPPPKKGDPLFALDIAEYKAGYALKGTPRWKQATVDSDMSTPNVARIFSKPFGLTISPETTPALYRIMDYLNVDSGDYAPETAKKFYLRERPFVYFKHHTCQPLAEENSIRTNGSYPSGHTAYATNIALILSQLRPDRGDAVLKRAWEYGQSRVICGAHWQSDVNAGRFVGGAEYSRLQSIPAFQKEMKQAQEEVNHLLKEQHE
ncbi:acid phosphatase (class A) [Izhakiella capsodis]|uniref:Acid phosphatase n=1 Tax=Izhakiella capsodis TaxID=1367852 RepID=A0A1I4WTM4_9GAMM|nr:phosphatase PAP2 family protein [Izhakiella capsodis]SFN16817.1 acid phosphatase (class A) [Izhakiella capsodis]